AAADALTQTAEQATQSARAVGGAVQRSADVGKTGRKAVEDSVRAMGKVREQVESIAEKMLVLADQARAIGEVIAAVNDIADQAIKALTDAVAGTAQSAAHIVTVAQQQMTGVSQVNQAMRHIDQVTRQGVAAVRQVEQAAQHLNDLSAELSRLAGGQRSGPP